MKRKLMDGFYWLEDAVWSGDYGDLVRWACAARGQNPAAFDAVTEWLLDDTRWEAETLVENRRILLDGLVSGFRAQNTLLRQRLLALPAEAVNPAVFPALDRFDAALAGAAREPGSQEAARRMLAHFSAMADRTLREQVAGSVTGPLGTIPAEPFGYINQLKDCDAAVQWTLFMPEQVKNQQQGFSVRDFSLRKLPALRFVGRDGGEVPSAEARRALFSTLDGLSAYRSGLDFDAMLLHHNGGNAEPATARALWGRFLTADAPVPEGFQAVDFLPGPEDQPGPPYLPQFAFAVFAGDDGAMHQAEGFDGGAMYDVTRNLLLARGVTIPYPDKYWVAEAFPDGHEKPSTAYLFSVLL